MPRVRCPQCGLVQPAADPRPGAVDRCAQCGLVQPAADPRPGAVDRCAQCGRAFRLKPLSPAAEAPPDPAPVPEPGGVPGRVAGAESAMPRGFVDRGRPGRSGPEARAPEDRGIADSAPATRNESRHDPEPDPPVLASQPADRPRPAWRSRRGTRRPDDDERPPRRDRDDRPDEDEDRDAAPPPRRRIKSPRRSRRSAGRPQSAAEYAAWVSDRFGWFGWAVIGFTVFQLAAVVAALVHPPTQALTLVLLIFVGSVAWLWVVGIALRDHPALGSGYLALAVGATLVAQLRKEPIGLGPLGLFPGILVPIYALARFKDCWKPLAVFALCAVLALPHAAVAYFTKPAAPDPGPRVQPDPPPGTPAAADPAKPAARPPLPAAVIPENPEPGAVYLSDLPEAGVVQGPWPLGKEGDTGEPSANPIRVGGRESPRGLGLHPPPAPGHAAVRYRLGKAAVRLKAGVALNDTGSPFTRATFEVWGDGKRLWDSPPVGQGPPGACEVDLAGVDVLELRTLSAADPLGVHAVWVEPRLEVVAGARLLPPGPPPVDLAAARERDGAAHLDRLPEYDVKRGPWPYAKDGTLGNEDRTPVAVGGRKYPRALSMAPPTGGFARAKFRLGGRAAVLEASVALSDTALGLLTGPVFEVWGDGKRLWRSPPVDERGKPLPCRVDLTGVDVLELRVTAARQEGAHAVWLDPRLTLTGE